MVKYKEIVLRFIDSIELKFEDPYHVVMISANDKKYRRMFRTIETAQKHFNMIQRKINKRYITIK